MRDPLDFGGRVVLVTGGTRGIGRGIATRFLGAGADVVVVGRNEPDSVPAVGGREAVFVAANVRQPDQTATAVASVVERYGRLDVLINNAGGSPGAEAATASPRFFAAIIDLNLTAPMVCAQRANAVMQAQDDGGTIINIASVSGTRPSPGTAAYGAAKAGLLSLTRSLAVEWAPKVRVCAVTAGLVQTERAHLHYGDEAGVARVAETIPLGRLGTPSDIGDACLYLASPLAAYVSGAAIEVHGGGERPAFLEGPGSRAGAAHAKGSVAPTQ